MDSNCLGLKFENCHGTPVNVTKLQHPIAITVPRDEAGELPESGNFTVKENTMTTHKLHIEDSSYSINAVVHPEAVNCTHEFKIFLRKDKFPTTEEFDFNWTIRAIPGIAEWREGFPLSVSNFKLNRSSSDKEVYYLGLYLTRDDESRTDKKCSEMSYKLLSFLSSCNFWDEQDEKWKASGCEVSNLSWQHVRLFNLSEYLGKGYPKILLGMERLALVMPRVFQLSCYLFATYYSISQTENVF